MVFYCYSRQWKIIYSQDYDKLDSKSTILVSSYRVMYIDGLFIIGASSALAFVQMGSRGLKWNMVCPIPQLMAMASSLLQSSWIL